MYVFLYLLAALGVELGVEAEIDKGVLDRRRHEVHGAAVASVSTVGAAARHVLLPAEAQTAAAAVAGVHTDIHFIDEHDQA